MEYLYKISWFFRFLLLRVFFGSFGFPGYLGCPVYLKGIGGAYLGRKVRIFPGIRLEIFRGGRVYIKDDVAFAQGVHITCKKEIIIESGVCVAANVCITDIKHNFSLVADSNILKQEDDVYPTYIGRNTFIGYGAVIDAGTVLGDGCVVGANSYVKGVFPPYSILAGVPAKIVKKYNS